MKFGILPLQGIFLQRLNRFSVLVELNGKPVKAHLPNSGRLGELLVPGRRCYVLPASNPLRKTDYDLILVETPAGNLTSTDARLPNRLFTEAFKQAKLSAFCHYTQIEPEVPYENSRLDFRLSAGNLNCYVEVKSVTLVEDGTALFPDAPTLRGTKHLNHLIHLKNKGHDTAIVFWVQRDDAKEVRPNVVSDPLFSETLRACSLQGVRILAYMSKMTVDGTEFMGTLPVVL